MIGGSAGGYEQHGLDLCAAISRVILHLRNMQSMYISRYRLLTLTYIKTDGIPVGSAPFFRPVLVLLALNKYADATFYRRDARLALFFCREKLKETTMNNTVRKVDYLLDQLHSHVASRNSIHTTKQNNFVAAQIRKTLHSQ